MFIEKTKEVIERVVEKVVPIWYKKAYPFRAVKKIEKPKLRIPGNKRSKK